MAMNDEETVALIAGGHTFGKTHGAGDAVPGRAEPEGADIAQQGLGWQSGHESGIGDHTITSGLEGTWTPTPTKWSNNYFRNAVGFEWELVKSPAGARSGPRTRSRRTWPGRAQPEEARADDDDHRRHGVQDGPRKYREDLRALPANPDQFADAFARAWFKLTHRDMGPKVRYLGPEVPDEDADLAGPDPRRPGAERRRGRRRSREDRWPRASASASW
jgi:catalase-peroxidase